MEVTVLPAEVCKTVVAELVHRERDHHVQPQRRQLTLSGQQACRLLRFAGCLPPARAVAGQVKPANLQLGNGLSMIRW
jgi:hypothetical protein